MNERKEANKPRATGNKAPKKKPERLEPDDREAKIMHLTQPDQISPDGLNPYTLRLYVAGQTKKSFQALTNLRRICDIYLQDRYTIEVIDLLKHPQLAKSHQILAIPTLVREIPEPLRKIIGDLSNLERVLMGLDLTAEK